MIRREVLLIGRQRVSVERRTLRPMVESSETSCSIRKAKRPKRQNRPRIMREIMQASLVDDIRRLIRPATGSFGRELWGEA